MDRSSGARLLAIDSEKYLLAMEKIAAQVLLILLLLVTFAQVVFRYVLHAPLPWSEELARYLFIWVSCIGAAIGVAHKDHFGIEFVLERLTGHARNITEAVIYIAAILFILILLVYGTIVTIEARHTAMALPLSMKWFYAAIPVGALLMLLHVIINLVKRCAPGGDQEAVNG